MVTACCAAASWSLWRTVNTPNPSGRGRGRAAESSWRAWSTGVSAVIWGMGLSPKRRGAFPSMKVMARDRSGRRLRVTVPSVTVKPATDSPRRSFTAASWVSRLALSQICLNWSVWSSSCTASLRYPSTALVRGTARKAARSGRASVASFCASTTWKS